MDLIQAFIKKGCPVTNCHNWIYDIQTWLRENHLIHINPIIKIVNGLPCYEYNLVRFNRFGGGTVVNKTSNKEFKIYEDALLDGITLVYYLFL